MILRRSWLETGLTLGVASMTDVQIVNRNSSLRNLQSAVFSLQSPVCNLQYQLNP